MVYHTAMTTLFDKILSDPRLALFNFGVFAAAALGMAFMAQYAYGLAPCDLCIFQRYPYALIIVLAAAGIWLYGRWKYVGPVFLGLTSLTFLANSVIAAYHTGVERKWWPSFLEGCTIPQIEGSITDVLAQIQAAPVVRCDEIPWTDPVLGLSMANYNVLFCGVLAVLAAIAFCRAITARA